jgi:CRP/FNR family transcriptional regulator, cyclic AMP receptor protein
MATEPQRSFDTKSFLAHVGDGRSVGKYRKGQVVFSQGDPGDAVFYIQKGKAKLTVVSERGKEAVIAILGAVDEFFGEGCLAGQAQRISGQSVRLETLANQYAGVELTSGQKRLSRKTVSWYPTQRVRCVRAAEPRGT